MLDNKRHILVEIMDGHVTKAYASDYEVEVVVIDRSSLVKNPALDITILDKFITDTVEELGMIPVPVSDLEQSLSNDVEENVKE